MGKYREKECKFCSVKHRKKGPYCSQSCASYDREPTDAQRDNMRKVAEEYNKTPEAIAKQKQINTPLASLTADDFAIDIPEIKTLDDYIDYTDGFDRAEKW